MPARYAILGLLLNNPQHGYDLDSQFDRGLRSICHVSISQIYAYLKSMEANGWIRSEVIYQESNPPKKVFHITEQGYSELQRWLSQPVETERQIRDRLLTKVYFACQIAPGVLPELLEKQLEIHREHLEEIEALHASASTLVERILAEAGIRHARADLEWLQWLIEEVEASEDADSMGTEGSTPT